MHDNFSLKLKWKRPWTLCPWTIYRKGLNFVPMNNLPKRITFMKTLRDQSLTNLCHDFVFVIVLLLTSSYWPLWYCLIVWIGFAMPYSFVRLYCFLDLFGLFGLFVLFQWFILTLGFVWTVLIVCIALIVWMAFEGLGLSWLFVLLIGLGLPICSF